MKRWGKTLWGRNVAKRWEMKPLEAELLAERDFRGKGVRERNGTPPVSNQSVIRKNNNEKEGGGGCSFDWGEGGKKNLP